MVAWNKIIGHKTFYIMGERNIKTYLIKGHRPW